LGIELVVFDMAGTTVYDGDMVNVCLREAVTAAGFEVSRDEINAVMGITKPVAIRMLLEQRSENPTTVAQAQVETVYADFLTRMVRHYETSPEVREVEGAADTFRLLREAGVKVALDTGFSRQIVTVLLNRLGWQRDSLIDASVAGDEVTQGRPYPDMIFRAMELTGIRDAGRVAKVGDTPADLQEGSAAGCSLVIGMTGGSHTREELLPHPHTHLLDHLTDVWKLVLAESQG